jgi:hypothetical protein
LEWIKIVLFIGVNIELRLTRGSVGISITAHEQAKSSRACNIFYIGQCRVLVAFKVP